MTDHVSLKYYPSSIQPRERLLKEGASALSQIELFAILLGTGAEARTALDLARDICLRYSLLELKQLDASQLCQIEGVGPAKAARILAALELGQRLAIEALPLPSSALDAPELIYAYLKPLFSHQRQEHFVILFLDIKCRLICHKVLSVGTLEGTLVHPREIFREALNVGAYALVAAHNHPSGDPEPSSCDLNTTRQLIRCGKLMQIDCLDHVILGHNTFWSIRAHSPALWTQNELLE